MKIVVPPPHVIEEVERERRRVVEQQPIQLPIPLPEHPPLNPDRMDV